MTVALATLLRVTPRPEHWTITAPSEKKAQISMGYVIDHAFDDKMFLSQLEIDTPLDRLRRERSRTKLTFKRGGSIQTLTLDAKNGKRNLEAAMGHGSQNVILDESSLIDDNLYATVKRMLGGYKDNFLFEIGNPFHNNHFKRTWEDPRYNKFFADYRIALAEGRYTEDYIEEMRKEAFFDVFYECRFPREDEVDKDGYRQLVLTKDLVQEIMAMPVPPEAVPGQPSEPFPPLKLGVDVAAGGDQSVFCLRRGNWAKILLEHGSPDTMVNVAQVMRFIEEYGISPQDVAIDDIGVGCGVRDRLREKGLPVWGVSVGAPAHRKERYANLRAELFWKAKQWCEAGGRLVPHPEWRQLTWVKYNSDTDKRVILEPKDQLKKRHGRSPDHADAFSLTFYEPPSVGIIAR
ncbi:MAG: hypothetical protein Q8Q08_12770 [Candidatus Omnitrophota bacterium]|nr:hypothetical protein [Candidatus Omnitrophota bacterium]